MESRRISIRIPERLYKALIEFSIREGFVDMSEATRFLIREGLASRGFVVGGSGGQAGGLSDKERDDKSVA